MTYKNIEDRRAASKRFYQNNLEKYRTEEYLASCRNRMRSARLKNPVPEKEAGKKWRSKTKLRQKDYHLRKNYGITLAQRDQMFLNQGSQCAVCKIDNALRWHVDHCHETKRIRGILCSHCNLMIGHAKDNVQTLLSAAEYLK